MGRRSGGEELGLDVKDRTGEGWRKGGEVALGVKEEKGRRKARGSGRVELRVRETMRRKEGRKEGKEKSGKVGIGKRR